MTITCLSATHSSWLSHLETVSHSPVSLESHRLAACRPEHLLYLWIRPGRDCTQVCAHCPYNWSVCNYWLLSSCVQPVFSCVFFLFCHFKYYCLLFSMWVCTSWHDCGGQRMATGSPHFLPCKSWVFNSNHHTPQQVSLSAEPSHCPHLKNKTNKPVLH